jgi:hypothetical protein
MLCPVRHLRLLIIGIGSRIVTKVLCIGIICQKCLQLLDISLKIIYGWKINYFHASEVIK